jgi:hypothetical protein
MPLFFPAPSPGNRNLAAASPTIGLSTLVLGCRSRCPRDGAERSAPPVISTEQLTAALQKLDPRDWEVLDLSLRRRVPDEALARLFDTEPHEVARRRAFAIEHLADELGVQRGEDLGVVLKALLEPSTWEAPDREVEDGWQGFPDPQGTSPSVDVEPEAAEADARPAEAPVHEPSSTEPQVDEAREPAAAGAQESSETARHFRVSPPPELPPLDKERERTTPQGLPGEAGAPPVWPPASRAGRGGVASAGEAGEPEPRADEEPPPSHLAAAPSPAALPAPAEPEPSRAEPADEPPAAATPAGDGPVPIASEPVLDMLAERARKKRRRRIRSPLLWVLAAGLGAVGLFAAGYVGARWFAGDDSQPAGGDGPRRFLPSAVSPLAEPFPSDPKDASCYSTVAVGHGLRLHERPGSKRALKLPARTEWGSPRVLSVVRRSGDWFAVLAPELKNGEVGWMRSKGAKLDCVRWSLHVDLSKRRLFVRKDGHTMRTLTIAIGSSDHPTPIGRFAVTDKLKVVDKGSPYGCCVLALTGHQTRLPPDWPGGDRLAVHATTDLSSIGKPVSLGCMRSQPQQVEWLIKTVPLGAPVFIRS